MRGASAASHPISVDAAGPSSTDLAADFASLRPVGLCYKSAMTRRPTYDARTAAEKAFKAATTKPVAAPPKAPSLPGAKETVTLRIDRDVLDFFQDDGPGWQERINAALRKAAGK
jgi:uncharacterized protein (DUF4415 family)